jgi:hypothetical protein
LFLKFHLPPWGFSFLPPPNISCNSQWATRLCYWWRHSAHPTWNRNFSNSFSTATLHEHYQLISLATLSINTIDHVVQECKWLKIQGSPEGKLMNKMEVRVLFTLDGSKILAMTFANCDLKLSPNSWKRSSESYLLIGIACQTSQVTICCRVCELLMFSFMDMGWIKTM